MRLTGLIAAPHTPMHPQGPFHPEIVDAQAELLLASGVRGAFVGGSTGECHSLASAERKELAARWVQAVRGRFPVIVHVGHNSLPEAQALAEHAAALGATAISAMAPCYFKPGLDALIDFCSAIAAAAPRLPFYFYDIPSLTGVQVNTALFLRQAAPRIPTLHGVKFTSSDLMVLQECLALDQGRFDIVFGSDEVMLATLPLGVRGFVGSTYNYAAPVYLRILDAFASGDLETARQAQWQSVRLVRALLKYGVLPGGKAIMGLMGIPCGPTRSPLPSLDADSLRKLYDDLAPLDIFARPLQRPA